MSNPNGNQRGTQGRPSAALITAKQDNPIEALRLTMTEAAPRLQAIVPRHVDAMRVIELATSNARRDPKLLQCTTVSILIATAQIAALGLEPGTALQQAYLVPRENRKKVGNDWVSTNEATAIIGYRGLAFLAYESERITAKSVCVYAGDRFVESQGLDPKLEHSQSEDDPGEVRGAYCVWRFPDGRREHLYWPIRKLLAHRDRHAPRSSYVNGNYVARKEDRPIAGPWLDHFEPMCEKTMTRMAAKFWPMSSERLRHAITVDDAGEQGRAIAFIPGVKTDDVRSFAASMGEDLKALDAGDYADPEEDPEAQPKRKPAEPIAVDMGREGSVDQ